MNRFLPLFLLLLSAVFAPAQTATEEVPTTQKLTALVFCSTPQGDLKLDLQRPLLADKPFPVLIWIHGGGWAEGKRGFSPLWPLSKQGYAVASIDYRFAPESTFPTQIVDVKSAIRWLKAHAKEYNLDPDRIGVAGESAGGHLAALAGLSTVKEWDKGENLEFSSRVQAVVSLCGPSNFFKDDPAEPGIATLLASGDKAKMMGAAQIASRDLTVSRLLGAPVRSDMEKAKAASPITYVTPASPPFFFIHGDSDYLVPMAQSIWLKEDLQKAGVEAELEVVKGAGHGFGRLPPDLLDKVKVFFDRHLKSGTIATRTADKPENAFITP